MAARVAGITRGHRTDKPLTEDNRDGSGSSRFVNQKMSKSRKRFNILLVEFGHLALCDLSHPGPGRPLLVENDNCKRKRCRCAWEAKDDT
jgi:hypothetical protein